MEKINQRFVLLDNKILNNLLEAAKLDGDSKEIGGLLLGYRRGKHLHVIKSTFPAKNDISQRYKFIRQDISHPIIAFRHWINSGRKIGLLGEWHTHPEVKPTPSSIDISSWKEIVTNNKEPMTFIIIGINDIWVGFMNEDLELFNLKLLEESEGGFLFENSLN